MIEYNDLPTVTINTHELNNWLEMCEKRKRARHTADRTYTRAERTKYRPHSTPRHNRKQEN